MLLLITNRSDNRETNRSAMESTGVSTPPGILPMVEGIVRRRWRRSRTDAQDDVDALWIHVDPLDEVVS